jgi:NPCBM/NEW2 domain/Bacterial Ig-like domain
LTLNGVVFAKGLGVHAVSDLRFAVPAGCSGFSASVGIDDEKELAEARVVFQVFGDGVLLAESGPATSSSATQVVTADLSGRAVLRLVVTDGGNGVGEDHADWADAKLTCGAPNTAPQASITTPTASTTWRVGQVISFSGSATDAEQGTLPGSALDWDLIIHHCPSNCHTHQLQSFDGVAFGSFTAPDHEYPSHLELRLTATDAGGLTDVESVELDPDTVVLSFRTSPTGLELVVGGSSGTTPFDRTVIVGSSNSVSAPTPQSLSGTDYVFGSWSDGGGQTHTIVAPASAATYTATYSSAQDTTPPTVVGRSPVAGASGVATVAVVSATFSEPVLAGSVSSSTVSLTKQGASSPVAGSVAYDAAARRATLTPSAVLDAGSVYVARVRGGATGVKDLAGNALAADETWSFTTVSAGGGSVVYVSDLSPTSAVNGWGPWEKDRSNGELAAGDGRPLTLNGVVFAKGLGVHAVSDLRFAVPAGCSGFSASVGIDDEKEVAEARVVFQVFGDGVLLAESGPATSSSATQVVTADLSGRAVLRLVVTDGGNGVGEDHADWADAKLTCS